MKIKNIISITFTLILGVVGVWAQTALPNSSATLINGTIYTATTQTINGTLTVPENGTVTIYIPAGITLTINGEDGTNSTGVSLIHLTGTVGQPGKPAINVPDGSTLIITGYGTLKAKGGRGGDGSSGTTGNGGSGAAPAIGGIGGVGGKGWTTSDDKNGKDGESMGNVYILDQVSIEAQKGAQGERHEYIFTGGEGGKAPNFSIGGGGAGGRSANGTDGNNGNNGNLYIQNTATVSYKDSQGNTDTSRPDVNVVPPTKTGYTFYGYNIGSTWVFDANGSIKDGVTSYSGSISEYWVANEYTVALDLQGGTGGTSSVTATYDSAMPSATAPTRTGYTFHGYFTEANGEGTKYYNADMSSAHIWDKANNTTTLYAHWTANSYTVTLDANGGTGGTTSVSATYDSAMPSATAPTRTGYTFTGYYYNDTQYYDGSMTSTHTWDRASATTLQAHWTINNYTLTYDVNGGNALSPDHKSVTYNTAYGELPTPTRTGYTFAGWFTEATGGEPVSNTTIMGAENVTIYAHWTANKYTLTFNYNNANGGNSESSRQVVYDQEYQKKVNGENLETVVLPTPTRTGYTFRGWFLNSDFSGSEVTNTTIVNTTSDHNLYAKWEANKYTVTFNYNGANGGNSESSRQVVYDQEYQKKVNGENLETVDLPTPTRTGYTFRGWFPNPDFSGTEVTNTTLVNSASNHTLYAKWEANEYTVSFNPQGGSPSPEDITVTYGTSYGELPTVTRTGYTFDGWFTEETSGTEVTSSTTVNITAAQTLYAHWTAKTYTVTLNPGKGTVDPESISVTYDATYGTIPTPTHYGFEFDGWYTAETGGTEVTSSTPVQITDDQTLYARWNPITINIDSYSAETQLGGNYFRTFYDSQVAHILPSNVTAYKGRIEGAYFVLTAIVAKDEDDNNIIPKDVPVILRMEPNNDAGVAIPEYPYQITKKQISLMTSESELTIDNTDNELIGSDVTIASAIANSYILSFGSHGLGFYEWATHPLEAHKAYVIKAPSNPAKALIFRFENDVTGINEAIRDFKSDDSNTVIYNLNGIRISKPQKGINIINGKKIWVK